MVMDKIFFYRPELFRNENGDNNMEDLTFEEFFENYEFKERFSFDEKKYSITLKKNHRYYDHDLVPLLSHKQYRVNLIDFEINRIEATFSDSNFTYDIFYCFKDKDYHVTSKKYIIDQLYNKHSHLHPRILILFSDYFEAVCSYRDANLLLNKEVGWTTELNKYNQTKYTYKYENERTEQRMIFPHIKKENPDLPGINVVDSLFNHLKDSDVLTTVFSYGLLSVSQNARQHYTVRNKEIQKELQEMYKQPVMEYIDENAEISFKTKLIENQEKTSFKIINPFFLCLHGENPDNNITRKAIASIFLDYTQVNYCYPNKVCNHLPHTTLGNLKKRVSGICKYADCPIIIAPSGNVERISTSSRELNTLEKLHENNCIKGFPVILSKSPIRRDCILNIDISTVSHIPSPVYNYAIKSILFDYIKFMTKAINKDISNGGFRFYAINHICADMIYNPFEKYSNIFYNDEYNENLAKCCRDILTALHGFTIYIHETYPELKAKIDDILENQISFLQDLARDCESRPQKTASKKTSKPSQNIKKDFFNVISKICQGQPNAIVYNETDVYIDYKVFQKYYARTDYKAFLNKCRSSSLVNAPVRPNTGEYRGFTYSRIINGKKTNVLVVPRKLYDKYVSNSPS